MSTHAWRIGRIAGIEIRIDPSWAVIVALIAHSFYVRLDELYGARLDSTGRVVLAAGSAALFFGSVLVHELAHSVTARGRGIPVRGITLFLFGGATEAQVEAREPQDEFVVTIVGPLTSLALAGMFGAVANVMGDTADPVPGTIGYLAWLNLSLAVFNLMPGLPLDGGRILRSTIWAMTGSLERATRIAARGGVVLGWTLIGIGLLNVMAGFLGGLWLAAIGWFLSQAARASYVDTVVNRLLGGVHARDLMNSDLVAVPAEIAVAQAIDDYFLRYDHSAFPVVERGAIVGLLSLRKVRQLSPADRARLSVRDAMSPLTSMLTVSPDTPMDEVVRAFHQNPDARVLVRDHLGQVLGIVTSHDVTRWLQRVDELGLTEVHLSR